MSRKSILFGVIAGLSVVGSGIGSAQAGDPTTHDISAAVFDYFDGQGERSMERLDRAFADGAMMTGVTKADDGNEAISVRALDEILPDWAQGEPTTAERSGKILSMSVIDDRIATVMFDSNGRFYDALTLAKINGRWEIIGKAYVRQ